MSNLLNYIKLIKYFKSKTAFLGDLQEKTQFNIKYRLISYPSYVPFSVDSDPILEKKDRGNGNITGR